ncbi:MAG: hypothetical protein KF708_24745 [Pirellulales bacterium]|nr:hypothetical protein [Pirellulales bacterium]
MFALNLLACSGPGAFRVMAEAQAYGLILFQVSCAMVALAIVLVWMRSYAIASSSILVVATIIHPGLWMSAYHGDCGSSLRAWALIWTILIVALGAGAVVHAWVGASRGKRVRQQTPVTP